MRKKLCMLVSLVFVIGMVLIAFTGCGAKAETCKVTFYDGETVVKTVEVENGGLVENFVPNPKGEFVFDKWYASPSMRVLYDFTKPIKAETKIFGAFRSNVEDTRVWEIGGAGAVEPLKSNNWGKGNLQACTLSKTDGSNEFVITITLYPDDLFQFAVINHTDSHSWTTQHGKNALKNAGEYFEGEASLGDADANIRVKKAGKFKFTVSTDVKNPSLDSISYTVVGEAPPLVPVPVPIVSGNINSSGIYADDATAKNSGLYLAQVGTSKVYEGTINFNEHDFFCVLPFNNWSGKLVAGDLTADSTGVKKAVTDLEKKDNVTITKAGKFKVKVDLTDDANRKITVTHLGDFEFDVTKHNVVNVYKMNGTEVDYKYYTTKGGKMVSIPGATPTSGKAFAGWYNGDNPFSFNTTFNVSGLTIDLKPIEISDSEKDPRSYILFGSGMTVGAKDEPNWSNGSALTQDAAHTYTLDVTFKAAEGNLTLKEKVGNMETGLTIKRLNVTGIADNTQTIIKGTPGNIVFAKAGTFKLSFNSFTQVLTITEITPAA